MCLCPSGKLLHFSTFHMQKKKIYLFSEMRFVVFQGSCTHSNKLIFVRYLHKYDILYIFGKTALDVCFYIWGNVKKKLKFDTVWNNWSNCFQLTGSSTDRTDAKAKDQADLGTWRYSYSRWPETAASSTALRWLSFSQKKPISHTVKNQIKVCVTKSIFLFRYSNLF